MFPRCTVLGSLFVLLLTCSCSTHRTPTADECKPDPRGQWISLNPHIDVDIGAGLACYAIGRRLCCMNEADLNDPDATVFPITADTIDGITLCNEQNAHFRVWGMGNPDQDDSERWPVRILRDPQEALQWAVDECRHALLHNEHAVVPGKEVRVTIYLRSIHDTESPVLQVIVAARHIGHTPPTYEVRAVSVRSLEEDEMVVR